MWSILRARTSSQSQSLVQLQPWKHLGFSSLSTIDGGGIKKFPLDLPEIEKILTDVKADDVKVMPAPKHCDWADFMVLATGRSTWHVRNIAQALVYRAKQKQRGVVRKILPSVEGEEGGKWIVIDSGRVIVHALEEKARAYYNLEGLWTQGTMPSEPVEDLQKAFVKVRRINNSKKKPAQ
ncbi:protein Iojap-related, mitochondrial [Lotus japonicus]|uniref:Ribosome silencing factor n=1 Tax=Lotus japonicus TaxID=34305 RepID=I3S833_LOTJA|nr:protein Iojap-related, mitochondrial [Lotus japonicus]AFK36425.1 unknown [Lotus japonicus]